MLALGRMVSADVDVVVVCGLNLLFVRFVGCMAVVVVCDLVLPKSMTTYSSSSSKQQAHSWRASWAA